MASPIGHSLLGLALGHRFNSSVGMPGQPWHLFSITAANAPDLDFVPGLFLGDTNLFHRGVSHSLVAAVVFGGIVALAMRPIWKQATWVGVAGAVLYASHLLLDFFTEDGRAPFGSPLLWPLSSESYISPWTIFGGVQHGVPGDGLGEIMAQVFSWSNVAPVALEALVLFPLTALSWWLLKHHSGP